jgi:CheY-like chemotaxis protein/HD-like signal output (HDOD) protein
MNTILVVDDMAILREPITTCLSTNGYTVLTATNGQEALDIVRKSLPDLILLDIGMPVMDGLAFLEIIRSEEKTRDVPVILLTAITEKDHILRAASLGARDYLLKSQFSLKELLVRVATRLFQVNEVSSSSPSSQPGARAGPSGKNAQMGSSHRAAGVAATPAGPSPGGKPARPALTRQASVDRMHKVMKAKSLSGVVAEVVALAASAGSDLSDLGSLIARDPLLSARVLRAANSSAYTTTQGVVSTIPEAVRNIGAGGVRNIAAACGVFEIMPTSSPEGFNPARCWQHSFAVAMLNEHLATMVDTSIGGVAYLVGLCHDLGDILIHTHFGEELRQIHDVQKQTGRVRADIEREVLGTTQGELIQNVLQEIGLPSAIRVPIGLFHGGGASSPDRGSPVARTLRLADYYANGILLASSVAAPLSSFTRADCRAATGQDDPTPPDNAEMRGQIFCLTGLLVHLSAEDEANLMKPLYERRNVQIWVARDPALSGFDPVAAALEFLATPTLHDRLPGPDELAGCQAVVVNAQMTQTSGFTLQDIQRACRRPDGSVVPVLWLCGKIDTPVNVVGITHIQWPIRHIQLASFIARAQNPGAPATAAAAA